MTDGGGQLPDLVAPLGVLAEIDEVGIKLAAIRASLLLTAVWMLNVAPRGRVYGLADYAAMLVAAGFDVPTRLEDGPWLQSRPVT